MIVSVQKKYSIQMVVMLNVTNPDPTHTSVVTELCFIVGRLSCVPLDVIHIHQEKSNNVGGLFRVLSFVEMSYGVSEMLTLRLDILALAPIIAFSAVAASAE